TGFGSNIFHDVGAIVPVNTAALLPGINDRTTALTNATLMQFFSPKFGIAVGKINTLDLSATEFYGDYHTQFMNAAFNFPMILEQVPLFHLRRRCHRDPAGGHSSVGSGARAEWNAHQRQREQGL